MLHEHRSTLDKCSHGALSPCGRGAPAERGGYSRDVWPRRLPASGVGSVAVREAHPGRAGRLQSTAAMSLELQRENFALIRPILGPGAQTFPHRVLTNVLPFRRVAFVVAQ
jgi:hypothetical protein